MINLDSFGKRSKGVAVVGVTNYSANGRKLAYLSFFALASTADWMDHIDDLFTSDRNLISFGLGPIVSLIPEFTRLVFVY